MAEVVDPVFTNPGSRVMTPSVVSSLEISTPRTPSVPGTTFDSSWAPETSMTATWVLDSTAGGVTAGDPSAASVTWVMGFGSSWMSRPTGSAKADSTILARLISGSQSPAVLATGRLG